MERHLLADRIAGLVYETSLLAVLEAVQDVCYRQSTSLADHHTKESKYLQKVGLSMEQPIQAASERTGISGDNLYERG